MRPRVSTVSGPSSARGRKQRRAAWPTGKPPRGFRHRAAHILHGVLRGASARPRSALAPAGAMWRSGRALRPGGGPAPRRVPPSAACAAGSSARPPRRAPRSPARAPGCVGLRRMSPPGPVGYGASAPPGRPSLAGQGEAGGLPSGSGPPSSAPSPERRAPARSRASDIEPVFSHGESRAAPAVRSGPRSPAIVKLGRRDGPGGPAGSCHGAASPQAEGRRIAGRRPMYYLEPTPLPLPIRAAHPPEH